MLWLSSSARSAKARFRLFEQFFSATFQIGQEVFNIGLCRCFEPGLYLIRNTILPRLRRVRSGEKVSVVCSPACPYGVSGPVRRSGSIQRAVIGTISSCRRAAPGPYKASRPRRMTRGIASVEEVKQALDRSWWINPCAVKRPSRRCATRCSRWSCTAFSPSRPGSSNTTGRNDARRRHSPNVSPRFLRLRKVSSAAVQPESCTSESLAAGNSYVRGVS